MLSTVKIKKSLRNVLLVIGLIILILVIIGIFDKESIVGRVISGGGKEVQTQIESKDIAPAVGEDFDKDAVPDSEDNCPNTPNSEQYDSDSDGIGDACDKCPNVAGQVCEPQPQQPTPLPQVCCKMETSREECSDNIDNDCDGNVDERDEGCCPDDYNACTFAYILNEECKYAEIPNCARCVFVNDCDDHNPQTYNFCVSGKCVFQDIG